VRIDDAQTIADIVSINDPRWANIEARGATDWSVRMGVGPAVMISSDALAAAAESDAQNTSSVDEVLL
jgi:hypothetical protein